MFIVFGFVSQGSLMKRYDSVKSFRLFSVFRSRVQYSFFKQPANNQRANLYKFCGEVEHRPLNHKLFGVRPLLKQRVA
jgi:hypothetical protein